MARTWIPHMAFQWNPHRGWFSKHWLSCVYKCDKASTSLSFPLLHFWALTVALRGEGGHRSTPHRVTGTGFCHYYLPSFDSFPTLLTHHPWPPPISSSLYLLPCQSLLTRSPKPHWLSCQGSSSILPQNPFPGLDFADPWLHKKQFNSQKANGSQRSVNARLHTWSQLNKSQM